MHHDDNKLNVVGTPGWKSYSNFLELLQHQLKQLHGRPVNVPSRSPFVDRPEVIYPWPLSKLRPLLASQVIYHLSYPGNSFLGLLLYITVNSSCHKFIRLHLNHIRSIKIVLHKLEKIYATNKQDKANDLKHVTDILTALCPIAIPLSRFWQNLTSLRKLQAMYC